MFYGDVINIRFMHTTTFVSCDTYQRTRRLRLCDGEAGMTSGNHGSALELGRPFHVGPQTSSYSYRSYDGWQKPFESEWQSVNKGNIKRPCHGTLSARASRSIGMQSQVVIVLEDVTRTSSHDEFCLRRRASRHTPLHPMRQT